MINKPEINDSAFIYSCGILKTNSEEVVEHFDLILLFDFELGDFDFDQCMIVLSVPFFE